MDLTGMRVSLGTGFVSGEDELTITGYTGPIKSVWDAVRGYITLTGSTDASDYIQAIRLIQYKNNKSTPTNGARAIIISLDDANYLASTGHFYRYIDKTGIAWSTSKSEAESAVMKYHGLQGYLATITSLDENNFIKSKTTGVGWIGASDQAVEGEWRWVTGPEGTEDNGKGLLFWKGSGYQAKTNPASYGPVNNAYFNWNRWDVPYSSSLAITNWEPNDSGGNEDYAHITYFPSTPNDSYKWNDLPNNGGTGDYVPQGYLIEYGGMKDDPVVNLTAVITVKVNTVYFGPTKFFTKCQGDTVSLNRTDKWGTYVWSPVAGLSNPTLSNPIATPVVTTNYHVVATNGICKDSANYIVNINPLPVSLLKKSVDVCTGNKVILDPGSYASYLWNTGSTSRALFVDTAGKYSVKLTSDKGCTVTDSSVVSIRPYPRMNLSGLKDLVCGSKATTLNISKDKGEWLITNLSTKEQFSTPAIHVPAYSIYPFGLNLSDIYGCSVDTFLTIRFYEATPVNFGNDTTICNPNSIVLDAGAGLASYQWSTGETNRKIEVKNPGKYNVLVKNTNGCYTRDSINVSFTDKPKLNLKNLITLFCGNMSADVNITVDKGKYQLNSKDPTVKINGMNATVPVYGNYPFVFVSTDQYRCSSDTTFTLGFHKIPKVKFSIDETECYGYNLQATYIGDANIPNAKFTWIFGGNMISSKTGQNIESIPLGVGQFQRDLKLIVNEDGCIDSSSIKDIHVTPTLSMTVAQPLQCLPVPFVFNGFNTETGVIYSWDLGDGTKSNSKDVTHQYAKDGYYDVSLTVTTDKGCSNTASIKKMVYVAPVPTAGFSIAPDICLIPGNDTLNYVGSAGTKDKFYWDLKGFDPIEIIQSPDSTPGPFIFNLINKPKTQLSLYVVSDFGCHSATASLEVKRKPLFSYNSSVKEGCAPLAVNFRAHADDPVDQLTFRWDYGDGDQGTGADINHIYQTPNGVHDVGLSAVSSITGCSDHIFEPKSIVVHPNPKAGFEMDHDIAYNDMPKVSFTDHSVDAINYYWDFGDGTHSREKNPEHNYEVVGKRKVLQTVYNQFDCSDTTSQVVLVAFNRIFSPNAFSPNAPAEIDRIFKLSSEGIKKEGYHLIIISRWNDIVFECRNEIKGWDGKMANGNYAPAGNYIWILECYDFLGRPHRQSGSLILIF